MVAANTSVVSVIKTALSGSTETGAASAGTPSALSERMALIIGGGHIERGSSIIYLKLLIIRPGPRAPSAEPV